MGRRNRVHGRLSEDHVLPRHVSAQPDDKPQNSSVHLAVISEKRVRTKLRLYRKISKKRARVKSLRTIGRNGCGLNVYLRGQSRKVRLLNCNAFWLEKDRRDSSKLGSSKSNNLVDLRGGVGGAAALALITRALDRHYVRGSNECRRAPGS